MNRFMIILILPTHRKIPLFIELALMKIGVFLFESSPTSLSSHSIESKEKTFSFSSFELRMRREEYYNSKYVRLVGTMRTLSLS